MSGKGLYAQFETNTNLEQDGVDLEYVNGDDTQVITIARAGGSNSRYTRAIDRLTKPHRRHISNGSMDPKQMEKILVEVYAESVVLKWSGVTDREGVELPFTKANAIKLFTDLPDLFRDVKEQAENMQLFRVEMLDEAAKN